MISLALLVCLVISMITGGLSGSSDPPLKSGTRLVLKLIKVNVEGDRCDTTGNCDIEIYMNVKAKDETNLVNQLSSVRSGSANEYYGDDTKIDEILKPGPLEKINNDEQVMLHISLWDDDTGSANGGDDLLYNRQIPVSRKFLNNGADWEQTFYDSCDGGTYCRKARVNFMIYVIPPKD